jgi:nucleoside-diphosphate-sugar epimerase
MPAGVEISASQPQENPVARKPIGIIGASSVVAEHLKQVLPVQYQPLLFSRSAPQGQTTGVAEATVPLWISVMPIWATPNYFGLFLARGARRIVAISSTSRFTKAESPIEGERLVAAQLAEGEQAFAQWASACGVEFLILRPTIIYGCGRDLNLSLIARFITRFGFFPVAGAATGQRQPLHAQDLAIACIQALEKTHLTGKTYEVSGGETLSYYEMVGRIFDALGKRRLIVPLPMPAFSAAIRCARLLPAFSHLTPAMARRMNEDLVFDHTPAVQDFGFTPRPFRPKIEDLLPRQPRRKD